MTSTKKQSKGPRGNGAERCPICASPAVDAYRPFCSKRCADVDLHRWLSESYAIPAAEEDDAGGEEG